MKQNGKYGRLIMVAAILVLVLVFIYSGLRILESTVLRDQTGTEPSYSGKTIIHNGVEYFPRQDITVVMLAGIDEKGPVQDSGSYNNPGESDMVSLLIFDESTQEVDILTLNRDTMMDIPVLGIGGKPAGTMYGQLALAHTFGSGLEDSCENLKTAVSDFLSGAVIDYYVALNMDAIIQLNDAVGGVTVNVTDDFSEVDPTISMGEMTLRGEQALHFVQTRQGVGNQLNLNRMARQEAYMSGFMESLHTRLSADSSFVSSVYGQIEPYMVTDCSLKVLSSLMTRYEHYGLGEIVSIKGENVKGEKYMEYYVDEVERDKIVLEYLFAAKQ